MSIADPSHRQATTSSARPFSKRISTAPTTPKAPTTLHATSTIANHALLTGHYPITISAHAVLHPYAKIISSEGPVEIGKGSMVWEKGVVGIASEDGEGEERATVLGRNVIIETGAVVEAGAQIGDGCVIEGFGRVGEGCTIGKYCKIMTQITLPPNSVLEDYTILYGQNQRRKDRTMEQNESVQEIKGITHQKQIKSLQQLIPSNLAKWSTA